MFTLLLFFAIILTVNPNPQEIAGHKDISHYLPKSDQLEEWQPVGSPQKFEGQNLYSLIDGGAVIYYEYGFRRVVTQEYENRNGEFICLEIYEMKNPASAYGIYSFKTGDDAEVVSVGTEGLLEDYYLNFWKGSFLVTLTAFDSEEEVLNGLLAIAKAVDGAIENQGQRPLLVGLLPKDDLSLSSIEYLKGNLALSNNYEFGSEDIFGLKEGVIANYGDFRIFIFKYDNEDESLKWFDNARNHLKSSSRFDGFTAYYDRFSVTDGEGKHVCVKPCHNYVLIFLGMEKAGPESIFEKLEARIDSISIF